jgi:hypothetical protein
MTVEVDTRLDEFSALFWAETEVPLHM